MKYTFCENHTTVHGLLIQTLHGLEDCAGDSEDIWAQRGHYADSVLRQEDTRTEQGRYIPGRAWNGNLLHTVVLHKCFMNV